MASYFYHIITPFLSPKGCAVSTLDTILSSSNLAIILGLMGMMHTHVGAKMVEVVLWQASSMWNPIHAFVDFNTDLSISHDLL